MRPERSMRSIIWPVLRSRTASGLIMINVCSIAGIASPFNRNRRWRTVRRAASETATLHQRWGHLTPCARSPSVLLRQCALWSASIRVSTGNHHRELTLGDATGLRRAPVCGHASPAAALGSGPAVDSAPERTAVSDRSRALACGRARTRAAPRSAAALGSAFVLAPPPAAHRRGHLLRPLRPPRPWGPRGPGPRRAPRPPPATCART